MHLLGREIIVKMKRISILLLLLAGFWSCTPAAKPSETPGDEPGKTNIRGIIYDDNAQPMAGVIVSDGYQCVKTGADGRFAMESDLDKVIFVSVVQPSGYQAAVVSGKSQFWKRLGSGDAQQINGSYQLRFTLNKIKADPERFSMIIAGDPQPRAASATYDNFAYHSLDCCEDMWKDISEYTSTISGRPIYGMMLGDIVHENMSLYANYCKSLAKLNFPFYSVIGNHDNDPTAANDDAGAAYFENNLGPRNYSFNVGKFHVVVLDNLIMRLNSSGQLKDYDQGLTDDIWKWLQNDLSYVDYSTPLIVCAHSPMFMIASGTDRSQTTTTRHGADYALLLSKYKKVYAWAGHVHNSFNYVYDASSKFPNIEVHTVSRATGALWINEWLCEDGTPRGYIVAEADGENLSWQFKPIAYQSKTAVGEVPSYKLRDFTFNADGVAMRSGKKLDATYQLRAYPRGTYDDKYVYANVFMYDEKWGDVKFTSSKNGSAVMSKVTEKNRKYDAAYKEVFDFYKASGSALSSSADFKLFDNSGNVATPVTHLFRCYSSAESDSGTVTVTDRFGNEYSTTVSW